MSGALSGRRLLITRPAGDEVDLARALVERGAIVIHLPAIAFLPPDDPSALERARHDLAAGAYRWLVVTSRRAVVALGALGALATTCVRDNAGSPDTSCKSYRSYESYMTYARAIPIAPITRVAALGRATAAACAAAGLPAPWLPARATAEALAAQLPDAAGAQVLYPRADIASPGLAEALRARGAAVDEVVAYRTVPADPEPDDTARLAQGVDAVAFASGSAVRGVAARLAPSSIRAVLGGAAVVCLGRTAVEAAAAHDLVVAATAEEPSTAGLVAALEDALRVR